MKIERQLWSRSSEWVRRGALLDSFHPQLVLVFGDCALLENENPVSRIRAQYPESDFVFVSSFGGIEGRELHDDALVATAIQFEKTQIKTAFARFGTNPSSAEAGASLARELAGDQLKHIVLFSDGQGFHGVELLNSLREGSDPEVQITGGMASGGNDSDRTLIGLNTMPTSGSAVAIGLYGEDIEIKCAGEGGWRPFGPVRQISRSNGYELFELDGKSALDLYKQYLGDQADKLPGSALHFPLELQPIGDERPVVRTVISINEETNGMVFAGDMPTGREVRFLHGTYTDLVDGAASVAARLQTGGTAEFVLCVSCIGRRIMLGPEIEDELDAIAMAVGEKSVIAGFYSHGEIESSEEKGKSVLQNQSIVLTAFTER